MKTTKALLAGSALLATTGAALAQDLVTVDLINPLPRSTIFYPLVAGEAMGYFEEEGIVVNVLPSETSIPYVAFVQNGQADLAILDPNEVFAAVKAGANVSVVFEANQAAPEGIAVAPDSPVQSVSELVGTTVGLVTDRDRAFLAQAMDVVGASIDDVTTVIVGESGPTLANALQSGSVSAISGAASDWLAIRANGIEVKTITPEELLRSPSNNFVITNDLPEDMRPVIEGFLRAWAKGAHVAVANQDALAEMLRRAVPEEWENEEFGQNFLEFSIDITLPVTEQYGELQTQVWTDLQPRLMKVGALDEIIPVETFLDPSYTATSNDWSREEVEAEVAAWAEENL